MEFCELHLPNEANSDSNTNHLPNVERTEILQEPLEEVRRSPKPERKERVEASAIRMKKTHELSLDELDFIYSKKPILLLADSQVT